MTDDKVKSEVMRQVDSDVRQYLRFFKRYENQQLLFIYDEISRAISNTKSSNYGCIACWVIKEDLKHDI